MHTRGEEEESNSRYTKAPYTVRVHTKTVRGSSGNVYYTLGTNTRNLTYVGDYSIHIHTYTLVTTVYIYTMVTTVYIYTLVTTVYIRIHTGGYSIHIHAGNYTLATTSWRLHTGNYTHTAVQTYIFSAYNLSKFVTKCQQCLWPKRISYKMQTHQTTSKGRNLCLWS